jgi:hypothetical protein
MRRDARLEPRRLAAVAALDEWRETPSMLPIAIPFRFVV